MKRNVKNVKKKTIPNVSTLAASTLAVHAGETGPKIGHSLTVPIFQTATYAFDTSREVRAYHESDIKSRFEYGRYGSPTQLALEQKLAQIHGVEDCLITASGMAAISVTLLSMLSPGDHLVLTSECYRQTRVFCEKVLQRYGVKVTFAASNAPAIIKAITPRTKMVFLEVPTNPHLYVVDVPLVAAVTRRKRIPLVVDSTIVGPFNFDPFACGADLVVLSLTKYFAGHNDVIAGAVLGSRNRVKPVRDLHGTMGALIAPQAAYLVIRGIKTLALRLERQTRTAERLAAWLEAHPKVRKVYYPRLASHPHHDIAARLFKGCGGVISFRLKGDLGQVEAFLDHLKIFQIAASLGGAESFAESLVTMSFWSKTHAERKKIDIPDDLVRLSCGIEDPEDLIADLAEAFRVV